ncbi:MAG: PAS domain S-box protein [Sphingobacteriaceae bacterium]|nr:MAG: PAS domain S-box protein [Sphingobacteriaceae bacterium]
MEPNNTYEQLLSQNRELRYQLEEANDAIDAIRTGQVDALIINDGEGHQLYTLKTADQTYRVFIEKMNEGAVTISEDNIILYCNSSFAKLVNLPLEKVIGLKFDTFVAPQCKEEFAELVKKSWIEDSKEEMVMDGPAVDKYTTCLISCSMLDLDEGPALSLIITDLTRQKETESQLQVKNIQLADAHVAAEKLNDDLEATVIERTKELTLSREHLKLLADNTPQLTWTNLPTGEVDFYNKRWYDYTGLTFQETKDWGWKALVHPDDINNTLEKYTHSLETGQVFEVETRYRQADGTYRWHLSRAVPLRDPSGEIIFWVGTATDIEEQKRQMDKKDEFIGIASHELKTPLTSLKGYLQLISSYKKEEVPAIVKQYVEKANISINKLQSLVNDLLDVSKIQAGRLEYRLETINVASLISTCIESGQHLYPDYIFQNNAEENYYVNANAERLEQVLMNLINNSVKYSREDKNVIISTQKKDNKVRISVTDFGIGLTDDQVNRIFERFYRVEDKKFMASGLGMGLYISAEIVKAHDGIIGVYSEPNKGATFYFDLPLL